MAPADLIVISDLHLGLGKNPATGRFRRLEAFFYDADLLTFCRWLCDTARADGDRAVRLIFNGDTFDFLRSEPERPTAGPGPFDRFFHDDDSPDQAVRTIERILAGHPRFCEAQATVLAAGHEIVMLPGNHDIELQYPGVQEVLRRHVGERLAAMPGVDASAAIERLCFKPWFHYEPGRVWIEHGCQYDPENAFRFPLRAGVVDRPDAIAELPRDMPLGNFFQRYLYNYFGSVTFIVPSTRANMRYMKFLLFNQPRVLTRVMFSHLPFVVKVLRRLAGGAVPYHNLADVHAKALAALATSSGLGERLLRIDALKDVRTDLTRAAQTLIRQTWKVAAAVLLFATGAVGIWLFGLVMLGQIGPELPIGTALLRTLALLTLTLLISGTTIGVVGWLLLRLINAPSAMPLGRAAQELANEVGVKVVSFGHTHDEVSYPLQLKGGRAWYHNTGTWIAVFTHDLLLPRERVQFTFLRVRGDDAELLWWSPSRRDALPVILIDEDVSALPY